jgi:hypothetical protein
VNGRERRHLRALLRRLNFLEERMRSGRDGFVNAYDKAEAASLRWVFESLSDWDPDIARELETGTAYDRVPG